MALQESRRIVAKEGLEGLTARRVAGAMGYSVGTLYNLFGNLDGLIMALNARTVAELQLALAQTRAEAADADVAEVVERMAQLYQLHVRDNAGVWRAVFDHHLGKQREVSAEYRHSIAAALAELEQALAPLYGADHAACATAARTLWSALHGICSLALEDRLTVVGAPEDPQEMARLLVRNFLRGARRQAP
ncbi:putative transcriptional regulator TetR [Magnetofaba australis IT-1]|uniref:Putative transcriptional regulator TetR n=2 Tax=Magnetofaba TaxID=1472292 RepID=A0A1Y2K6X6_9PROT|nr:putative transcriptional regulator TetR [Magnetofaba australis IT-1]